MGGRHGRASCGGWVGRPARRLVRPLSLDDESMNLWSYVIYSTYIYILYIYLYTWLRTGKPAGAIRTPPGESSTRMEHTCAERFGQCDVSIARRVSLNTVRGRHGQWHRVSAAVGMAPPLVLWTCMLYAQNQSPGRSDQIIYIFPQLFLEIMILWKTVPRSVHSINDQKQKVIELENTVSWSGRWNCVVFLCGPSNWRPQWKAKRANRLSYPAAALCGVATCNT
jgi:hypothetical protein